MASIVKNIRDGFGDALVTLARSDSRVVALTANLGDSTKLTKFQEKFPERYFEVGVAEQNLLGVAAGLALGGKVPFATSYAVFSPGRNWDQLRVSICYSRANVKIVSTHAGLNVGPDGATHQGLEDIALTRVLPNLTVIVPCDYYEAYKATLRAAEIDGPVYLRLPRENFENITTEKARFEIGRANILEIGDDITLIGAGPILREALLARLELARYGIELEVINCHTVKPLDEKTILKSVKKTGRVITLEEHQINGGLGSAVAELLSEKLPTPIMRLGVRDRFAESGRPAELFAKYEINSSAVVFAAKKMIKRY